jgi:preprotein translocase subunit SecD
MKSRVLMLIGVLGVLWLAILGPGWYWYSVRNPSLKGGTYLVLRVNTDDAAKVSGVQEVIRRRLRGVGLANPAIQLHGPAANEILVSLPVGVHIERAKNLIANSALLEIKIVQDGPADGQTLLATRGNLPEGMEVVPAQVVSTGTSSREYYLVRRAAVITGADISSARSTIDELGLPAIKFTLSGQAVATFSRATGENVGRQLAIILNGEVLSAPQIRERILGDEVMITGTFTKQEAADLATLLRNGTLPASVTFLEEGITK